MTRNWTRARIVWAMTGLIALAAGAAGAYFSLRPIAPAEPAPPNAPVAGPMGFRLHDAPRPLPAVAFEDAEGGRRSLSQFGGKVVLLNIWATWCAPCREEMPALDRLQRKLGGPGFEVLALSIDSSGAPAVKRFYEETGVRSLTVFVDPSMRATATLAAVGVPTTLLIDRHGREIGRLTGPAQWDSPQLVRLIENHLKD